MWQAMPETQTMLRPYGDVAWMSASWPISARCRVRTLIGAQDLRSFGASARAAGERESNDYLTRIIPRRSRDRIVRGNVTLCFARRAARKGLQRLAVAGAATVLRRVFQAPAPAHLTLPKLGPILAARARFE